MTGIIGTSQLKERADLFYTYGEPAVVDMRRPVSLGELPHEFAQRLGPRVLPKPWVAVLDNVTMAGAAGVVFDKNGDVVLETAFHGRLDLLEANDPYIRQAWRCVKQYGNEAKTLDVATSLVSIWANNYFHVLLELYPKIAAIEGWQKRHQKQMPTRIVEPTFREWAGDALAAVDITAGALVTTTQPTPFKIGRLVIPGWPRRHGIARPDAIRFVRERALWRFASSSATGLTGKYVWVTRYGQKDRHVINEDEVYEALGPLGFTFIDPGQMSFEEQVVCFRNAEMVVGPHGAGMTNALFARPGCRVLELFGSYINPCLWGALHPIGHRWGVLMCEPAPGMNMKVDISMLKETIAHLLEA